MIDSHAHINPKSIKNIDETIEMINHLDYLNYVINVGLDYETSKYSIELSNRFPKFYSVIGIHPLYEGSLNEIYNLYKSTHSRKVVGIGETGLDKQQNLDKQLTKFYDSIELANALGLPLVIHSNNANYECLKALKKYKPMFGFIFHCFQPDLIILKEIINMGGYISVGTPITRPTAKKSLEVVREVDINRILIELDYPYMSKSAITDGKNVFNRIRNIRSVSYRELNLQLEKNTKRLFKNIR